MTKHLDVEIRNIISFNEEVEHVETINYRTNVFNIRKAEQDVQHYREKNT